MEYGCIGEKLSHSFSKTIHNLLFDYDYQLKEIPKGELAGFMRSADFKAINVTIPYKQDVIPFLDYIEETAKKIGAVNTIVKKDGKLYGYNTDFSGMSALIKRNNIILKDKKVLILGAGGTSKTVLAVSKSLGAREILRVNRTLDMPDVISYEEANKFHTDAQIIINTTPCGMYPKIGESAVDIDNFPNLEAVADAVYNPLASHLVVTAKEKGINAVGGLYMLVAQAVFAAEKFTGDNIKDSKIEEVYSKILLSKKNLVLIGMPGCGKTTIGKALAKELDKVFIDTDLEIVKRTERKAKDIIESDGEAAFRKIESEVIADIAARQGAVIATGGGAVLNKRNVELLKENGTLVFIDKPLDLLATTDDRPLSSSRELLKQRYRERYHIYKNAADCTIAGQFDLAQNIKAVKEVFLNENSCN
ncbi:MAG: shikimate kinase [Acutalibacteraceae bacterium]|jgi:shikimate dehydrogenase